ncbi:MAG: 30S ribosomal protein S17 [Clostridia bacterium 62_21]|nr:MAG: 30S ribosomal protein S17 [Clostridia bacterium 62_21]HAG07833.1 30S ribosomal protein S17 [Peptococcaceae bacterium]
MERGHRKTRTGYVVSDKMDKTVVVAVERLVRHPLYGRTVRRTKKFLAHDENNACRPGDRVLIMETRPLSRRKRWRVVEILARAEAALPGGNDVDSGADDAERGR